MSDKKSRDAKRVFKRMLEISFISPPDPRRVGAVTQRLSEKDRKCLEDLKAHDIYDRII